MSSETSIVSTLKASLGASTRIPDVGRWLGSLSNAEVLAVALSALGESSNSDLRELVCLLMSAEGLYRTDDASLACYTEHLGWCAVSEYAYRMDWATMDRYPTLTRDARETTEIKTLGAVMMEVLGPSSRIVQLLNTWSIFDRVD